MMEPKADSTKKLSTAPSDVDTGSSLFVVTYLTMKHGPSNKEVFFEYGPNMDVSPNELRDGSFSGIGDNMKWAEVLWKFSIEGTSYVLRAPMNSPKMGLANSGSFVAPSPERTLLPDGSVLSTDDLKGFRSYPFQQSGILRDAHELGRDGEIVFIDVSDDKGQDHLSGEIIGALKSSSNVKNMFHGMGSDFTAQKSLMFAGPGNQVLKWPDGTPDPAVSRRVAELIKKAGDQPDEKPEESKFKPINDKGENERFSGDKMDLGETQEKADKLKKNLSEIKETARDLGLIKKANRVIAAYVRKKSF